MKFIKKGFLLAGAALITCVLISGCRSSVEQPTTTVAVSTPTETTSTSTTVPQHSDLPWENGGKQPEEYTWEEFEALSAEHQIAFQSTMGQEGFAEWMDQAQNQPAANPWDEPGARQPADYTWEEFEALSAEHQIAFQNAMGQEEFVEWMAQAQSQPAEYPWEEAGAKQLEDYTWEEFEALSAENQIVFQNAMGQEGFAKWMDQAQNQSAANPWDKSGAKQPEDYTWEEFEALSAEDQIGFQNVLGMEAFAAWFDRVNP